jgi:predicted AAA+ superfamily ATPase
VASGKPLTRAQWVIRGDAICARTNAQLTATTAKTLSEFSHKLPEAVAYYQTELAALSKLVPPTSKANDWQEFLTGTLQISQNTAKLAEIAQARQITLHEPELFAVNKIREVITRVAKRDGFKDCSEI